MKNILLSDIHCPENPEFKLLPRIMRISIFLLFCCVFSLMAKNGYSQNAVVTINRNNVQLEVILNEIESQTDYLFIYKDGVNVKSHKSIQVNNRPVSEVLTTLLAGTSIAYKLEGNHIILTQNKASITQQELITGVVTDGKGEQLVGVTIMLKGTTRGTITDADGRFSLQAEIGNKLMISYVGYTPQEIMIKDKKSLRIIMQEDIKSLNEVVVIGYGTQKKGEVASAISSVKSDNFIKVPSPDAAQMIRGQVAGLSIVSPDANPLSSSELSLRGITTLLSSTSPLVLIDGIPGSLNTVSPDEIAQIDVLKDGSAAAIYGTRGTNGVIIVTTKSVKGEMPTTVDVNAYLSVQQIVRKLPMMTAAQYREKAKQGLQGAIDYGGNVDWLDEITQTPISQVYNISLRGGSRTTNYTASFEYRSLEGIIKRSDNQIIYPRIEIVHRMFNDKLKINAGMNGSLKKYFDGSDGGGYKTDVYAGAIQFNPTDPIKDENGNWKERSINDYLNPLALLWEADGENKETNLRMFANLVLTPIEGLDIKYTASSNRFNQIRGYYETKKHSSTTKYGKNGYASRGTQYTYDNLSELTAQYNKTLFKDHYLTLLAGYSWMKSGYEDFWMQNWDFPSDDYTYNSMQSGQALRDGRANENSYKSENMLVGYFGRFNYSYKGKYILSASVRREGSSKFGDNYKWGTFPAVSVAWNIKEENFLRSMDFLSSLKLRAGFGITGTEPGNPYMSLNVLSFGDYTYFGNSWIKAIRPDSNTNPDLRWEKKEEINIGLDLGFFDERLTGSIDFYRRNTKDLIWNYNVPSPPYIFSTITANGGSMRNSGIEVSLQALPIKNNDFQWITNINYSTNSNKMLSFSDDKFTAGTYRDEGWTGSPIQQPTHRIEEGQPFGNFWGYKTIDIDDNGHWIIEDKDGNPKPIVEAQSSDKKVIGNGLPKHYLNWNNTFRYKNFDLGITMRGAFGFQIWNTAEAFHASPAMFTAGWNAMEKAFEPVYGKKPLAFDQALAYVSYYIENGNYWKIDNLTLGYTYNTKVNWLNNIRFFGSISNLAVITGYNGIDPETPISGMSPGVDNRYRYPSARTYTFGVSFKF